MLRMIKREFNSYDLILNEHRAAVKLSQAAERRGKSLKKGKQERNRKMEIDICNTYKLNGCCLK